MQYSEVLSLCVPISPMDTQQLALFLNLSQTLHFGRTSELMHLSVSAVSRSIKRLEEEVGHQLLVRDSRSVRLTEAGRKFQEFARTSLVQWQLFADSLRQDAEHLSGEVAVFCSVTAVYGVLAGVLEQFRRRYPDIDIKLHTGDQADAIDHVLAGEEDIAITARPDRLPGKLQFQTLTHSPLVFIYPSIHCAATAHIKEALASVREPDWRQLPFIVSERGQARVQLDQWLNQLHVKASIYAQVSGHEAIVSMVALGFGIGVVPELVLSHSPLKDSVQILDVQPPLTPFSVGLCTSRERLKDPLVRAFWECAGASYRPDF